MLHKQSFNMNTAPLSNKTVEISLKYNLYLMEMCTKIIKFSYLKNFNSFNCIYRSVYRVR